VTDLDALDPTFLADLRESRTAVGVVADWLVGRGHPVIVHPTFERPTAAQWRDYTDDGDLDIVHRVEVKRRTFPFTCREDYPYPTVFVDNARRFDAKRPTPFAYVLVSEALDAVAIVLCHTRSHWTRSKQYARNGHRHMEVYECPFEHVTFVRIEGSK
jgi:hypothetical protein